MDATPSSNANDVYSCEFLVEPKNPEFPFPLQQKNTLIKYTKLPEFDLDSKGLWPRQSYASQPRSRRFITFQEPMTITTSKTMSAEVDLPNNKIAGNLTSRKIVTIIEGDEHDLKPHFSKIGRFISVQKVSRAGTANLNTPKFDIKDNISARNRKISYKNIPSKYRESKPSAKFSNTYEATEPKRKIYDRRKAANITTENNKPKTNSFGKDILSSKPARSIINKNIVPETESEKEVSFIKSKLNDNETVKKPRTNTIKKSSEKVNMSKSMKPDHKSKNPVLSPKDISRFNTNDVIHVPLEDVYKTKQIPRSSFVMTPQCVSAAQMINQQDENVSNDAPKLKVNSTITVEPEPRIIYKYLQSTDVQTELIKETFDNLDIPNVTLTKAESDGKSPSKSLRNMPLNGFRGAEEVSAESNLLGSPSYIISRATLTYTTEQKFDLHVVGNNDDAYSNHTPSPLSYPINVVSVYKKEIHSEDSETKIAQSVDDNRKHKKHYKNRMNNIKSFDCSSASIGNQLMKPSDIISRISVDKGKMRNDYICDQFQRELNFIDSFFESLMYLESSLTKKYATGESDDAVGRRGLVENTDNFGYENFISNFGSESIADESETMASKNLFLVNILIRDEQRRAKNLLLVLKRREDALKEFTKSQILYLESKKRQEHTDASALKKRQRGALLRLQHECGEVQRMRRALLALARRRRLALANTKRDLELKLKSNVHVHGHAPGKKMVKRSASAERASPLKCFDLSSSGCEDGSPSRRHSVRRISTDRVTAERILSAEKSIQTGDTALLEGSTSTADENFIIVDGGYLNILFHDLSLPRIFSDGKQYEVNEPALKNIVESCNSQQAPNERATVRAQALVDNLRNRDSDASSAPSTARSLLDEVDHYYKVLPRKYDSMSSKEADFEISVCELKDAVVQADTSEIFVKQSVSKSTDTLINSDVMVDKVTITAEDDIIINDPCDFEVFITESIKAVEPCACEVIDNAESKEVVAVSPTGPLPVPAGAAASDASTDVPAWHTSATTSTSNTFSDNSLSEALDERDAVTLCEAEELRMQQLAIEREIKELEQQQCLATREIPDKPPPPYTPPAPPRLFKPDDVTADKIRTYMSADVLDYTEPVEAFDVFIQDFCKETLERTRQEQSDLPWECSPAPAPRRGELADLAAGTAADLDLVLAGAQPTLVCGIRSRRSDYIDDVLFTEWRRAEPEWTALRRDEALVKNLVFETIFQRILTDTVDEYKRNVLSDIPDND